MNIDYLNRKIVIVGGNHHNTLSMVRCFGECGIKVDLIVVGTVKGAAVRSKYVEMYYLVRDVEDVISVLMRNYANEINKATIISCADDIAAQLDVHYSQLISFFNFFHANEDNRVSKYMNKLVQVELAKDVGLHVPFTTIYQKGGDISFDNFPYLLKPLVSKDGGKRIHICSSKEELEYLLVEQSEHYNILVQEYIIKEYEIVVLGVSINDDVLLPGYIRKIRENKGGTTYATVEDIGNLPFELIESCKLIIRKMGYEGLFGIEFIYNKGEYYFIEVNLRNDATCYALAKAGVNLPLIYFLAINGMDYRFYLTGKVSHLTSMVELKDFKFVLKGQVSLVKWMRELCKCDVLFYCNKEDMNPFWFSLFSFIVRPFCNILCK